MKNFFLVFLLSFLLTGKSHAWTLKGALAHSCGRLLTAHENKWQSHMDIYKQGALGFITAMNFVLNTDAASGIDEDSIYYDVLNYCRKEPLKDVFDAAFNTYQKLK